MDEPQVKRGRGRPKGSKTKVGVSVPQNVQLPRETPPGLGAMDDYRAPDPLTMVSRHYAMIDWQQQALRNEMKIGLGAATGVRANEDAGVKLVDIGTALMKAMESHKRALALTEELSKHKTPEQMLEIAIKKIEGQDLPTLETIIKRLRKHRAALAPTSKREELRMGDSAAEAMASLGD